MKGLPALLLALAFLALTAGPSMAQDDHGQDDRKSSDVREGGSTSHATQARNEKGDRSAGSGENETEPTTAAPRGDGGRGDGEDRSDDKRHVDAEAAGDHASFTLEREKAVGQDRVQMTFDAAPARFATRYDVGRPGNESSLGVEARFLRIAEYRDANGNGQYDPGETLVSAWRLSAEDDQAATGVARWHPAVVEPLSVNHTTGQRITASADIGTGQFGLRMTVFGDYVDLASGTLRPTGCKIDVLITSYPFQGTDTALVLFLETRTKAVNHVQRTDTTIADDEEGLAATRTLGDRDVRVLFTWKQNATVDGVERRVGTTSLRARTTPGDGGDGSEIRHGFALSYARGAQVVHDPEAYVVVQSIVHEILPLAGDLRMVVLGAASAVVVVAATMVPRLRPRP